MEEFVGNLWHKWITRQAACEYRDASVDLLSLKDSLGVVFRALGGERGIKIQAAIAQPCRYRRHWLQRIAGSYKKIELCYLNRESFCLPAEVALFADAELNRELYFWWAAMAAWFSHQQYYIDCQEDWLQQNQRAVKALLERYPGLLCRYQGLVAALLALRPDPLSLPQGEADTEKAIREALEKPGNVEGLRCTRYTPFPVWLWLYPSPDGVEDSGATYSKADNAQAHDDQPEQEKSRQIQDVRLHRRGETIDEPDGKDGLLLFRLESLFSWSEMVDVDRTADDSVDDDAPRVAEDLDIISVAKQRRQQAASIRFDLDLPAMHNDDLPLGEGIYLPEWDYRDNILRPDFCCLQPMLDIDAEPQPLPAHLQQAARRLRAQFSALVPLRHWERRRVDGEELDLDAWLDFYSDLKKGKSTEQDFYKRFRAQLRDLDCLILADLSMSTDAYVNNQRRVIDVIKDSLLLFSEALTAVGDRFALYGFSSRSRHHVRFHLLKNFSEPYGDCVRGRLLSLRPGYYTRMGAAIRQATEILLDQRGSQRLLLLLTDGKPNDLDAYEGRYGIEDTRNAILEARRAGLTPFCITIDDAAQDYLPHLFGSQGYAVIHSVQQLPRELPRLYAQLTH